MDEHDELAYHAAMATARTYLSALAAEDKAGCNRILCDLGADKDGNTIRVVQALGAQALDFADVLDKVGMLNGGLVARRNEATLVQLDLVEAGSGGGGMPGAASACPGGGIWVYPVRGSVSRQPPGRRMRCGHSWRWRGSVGGFAGCAAPELTGANRGRAPVHTHTPNRKDSVRAAVLFT